MKYLLKEWPRLKKMFLRKIVFLFLDYDGTLSPIAKIPEKAVLPQAVKGNLEKISKNPKFKLAIVSGRELLNIKRVIGIPGIVYVGNHGLEMKGPGIKFKNPVSLRTIRVLQHVKDDLKLNLSVIKGSFAEYKKLSLSVHYRLIDRKFEPALKKIVHNVTRAYEIAGLIKVTSGKKVFEIRPAVKWNKGKAALWLFLRWRFNISTVDALPVYMGDDTTDEDAFRVFKNKGITIFVGKSRKTSANYYLKDTKDVACILKQMSELRTEHGR